MADKNEPLRKLIEGFERMPNIGHKTAARLAYFMVTDKTDYAQKFAETILEAKEKIHYCSVCQNLTDKEVCNICTDDTRDKTTICVVEDPQDVRAFERTREYKGLYHVLHGAMSPINGVLPDQLMIKELMTRLTDDKILEVIIATNPTVDGEATAGYLVRLIKPLGIKVSRLAYGVPVGGDLEYADEFTLMRAMEGRKIL